MMPASRHVPDLDTGDEAAPRSQAIEALAERARQDPEAVRTFLTEHELPLAEPPFYTFVYHGPADHVNLRSWIFGMPTSQPLQRLPGTDLWHLTLEIPDDSRLEYKFEVLRGRHHEWIEDPANDARAHDPFGANSVLSARGYASPEWAEEDPDARHGRIEEVGIESGELGGQRALSVYTPARFRERRRYPLLIVHDGLDYVRYSNLKVVLDNLIHRLEIPPLVAALTQTERRLEEYAAHEPHSRFLVHELVPWMEAHYPLLSLPRSRGLMGASLGAVASLAAAAYEPGFFGRLLLQSGSFAFTDIGRNRRGPVFEPIVDFVNGYRADPVAVSDRVYVTVGRYESVVSENRALVPVLRSTGMRVEYQEARDGHNWENWRDRLRGALSWLFPGPLWMVYE